MAVAEIESDRVIANLFPSGHLDTVVVFPIGAAVLLTEDVFLAALLGAGGGGTKSVHRKKGFSTVAPGDRDFVADKLDIARCLHGRASDMRPGIFASQA